MDRPHTPQTAHTFQPTSAATRVVVLGTGYVGLTAAACFAELGHDVVGLDIDARKVDDLSAGRIPIVEDGLTDLVTRGLASGRLRFGLVTMTGPDVHVGGDGAHALGAADVVLMCLATPTAADGSLDTSILETAARSIGALLPSGAVVVTKSTVPVGTHTALRAWLGRHDVAVVSNPEFLREGTAVHDFFHPDRVVVGGDDPSALDRVAALYAALDAPVYRMDAASSELVKVGANAFLATRLSFVNEMGRLCEQVGADIGHVTRGMGADHRIGSAFLRPGPGWGGSCFPKDTRGLVHLAASVGVTAPVIGAAVGSNEVQIDHVVSTARDALGGALHGSRIAVWGMAFKAGTDDCRDSTAIRIIEDLVAAGAEVVMTDPEARTTYTGARRAADPIAASCDVDVVLVLTEWPQFAAVPLDEVAAVMAGDVMIDCRDLIDPEAAGRAGVRLIRLGRPAPTDCAHGRSTSLVGAA